MRPSEEIALHPSVFPDPILPTNLDALTLYTFRLSLLYYLEVFAC